MSTKVVIIAGSPSRASRLTGLLEQAETILSRSGATVEWISVSELPAEDLIKTRFDSPAIAGAVGRVAEADAVIVASPVYKAAYSGILKTFLDLLPQKGLERKAVLPVFIGGSIAHLLAVDYSLKPVLSALGARYQLAGVYAVDKQVVRTEDGYQLEDELIVRLEESINELLSVQWPAAEREVLTHGA